MTPASTALMVYRQVMDGVEATAEIPGIDRALWLALEENTLQRVAATTVGCTMTQLLHRVVILADRAERSWQGDGAELQLIAAVRQEAMTLLAPVMASISGGTRA